MQKVAPEGCQTLKMQIWTLLTWAAKKSQGRPKVVRVPSPLGTWTWYLVLGVLGTRFLVDSTWYLVLSSWCLALSTEYLVLLTGLFMMVRVYTLFGPI